MSDLPTSMDELVRDSRDQIEALRRVYGNREDFDHFVMRAIDEHLAASGQTPKVRAFVLKAMFRKEHYNA